MKKLTCILFFLLPALLQAEDTSIYEHAKYIADSLKKLLRTQSLTKEKELYIKSCIVNNYALYCPDSTIVWGGKTIQLAKELNNLKIEANIYRHIGVSWNFKSNYDSAFIYYGKARDIAKKLKDKGEEANVLSLYARIAVTFFVPLVSVGADDFRFAPARRLRNACRPGEIQPLGIAAPLPRYLRNRFTRPVRRSRQTPRSPGIGRFRRNSNHRRRNREPYPPGKRYVEQRHALAYPENRKRPLSASFFPVCD